MLRHLVSCVPECRYCGASIDDDAYNAHLAAEHDDELGPIDRRRAADHESDGSDSRPAVLVSVAFVVLLLGVVAAALFLPSSDSPDDAATQIEPTGLGSVHYHGTLVVLIDGQRVDFSRGQYQLQADAFHFEGGNGQRWHVHARQVTLNWALATLGIEVTDSTVSTGETTYRDAAANTEVSITVNGQPVDPGEYVLKADDRVRIVVEQS